MAEEETTDATPTTNEVEAAPESVDPDAAEAVEEVRKTDDDTPLGPAGEKALEAFKARARKAESEARELAARVKEFEDRDLSEQERLAKTAEEAKAAAEKAEAASLRLRVAVEKGLPVDMADRMVGNTREELEADADQLAAFMKPREVRDFDGGARQSVKGIDRDEAIRLLREDPEEFHRRRDAGEIPADVLAV